MVNICLLLQDENISSKKRHTSEAAKLKNPCNVSGTALPKPAKEAAAELGDKAVHVSTAMPTHTDAAMSMATTAPEAARSQAFEASQPQAVPILAKNDLPGQLTTPAAPAVDQALCLQMQPVDKLASMSTPMMLQQGAVSTVVNSPPGEQAAGKDLPSITHQKQKVALADTARYEREQVTKDEVMVEAIEAADQLPLSYPATLVATLPCTVPAWLAHSQRTTAAAVLSTQLAPTQLVQASIATARLTAPSADTAALTKRMMPSTSTGRMVPHGALQDKPQNRSVSRLSQLGDMAAEGMPDQAIKETSPTPSGEADRKSASTSGQAQAAAPVAARAGLQHAALAGLSVKAAEKSSAVNFPAALPDEARAAGSSPRRQVAELGKRAADCSPGAFDVAKVVHKRARSDSPTAKPEWRRGDGHDALRKGPSDADVQVWQSPPLLTINLTEPLQAIVQQYPCQLHSMYRQYATQCMC